MKITKVISERGFMFPKYKKHVDSKHSMHVISLYICKEPEERHASMLIPNCHKITHNTFNVVQDKCLLGRFFNGCFIYQMDLRKRKLFKILS